MEKEKVIELVKKAKKSDTKYVVYCLDGNVINENSKFNYVQKSHMLMEEMVKRFLTLEQETGKKILVENKFVKLNKTVNDILTNNSKKIKQNFNPNFDSSKFVLNFNFYSENITDEMFKKVYEESAKAVNNKLVYNLSKQKYETTNYHKSGKHLWIGYAQQYLAVQKNEKFCELQYKAKETELTQ